ncbi:ABC transporter ATP-binding protein [Glycomyces terrestris]|uniref:ATP-binding cassette domain-containing protein n=1 Tax=Glycomyces terrestris TaxID=2493553 RepID=A0A426V3V8_9ACTN|nr:ATP-binding cassette domain-containing protein [Glycomyces terrestris]RRS01525.1 ATP-binding cassette domain-containing protein [Glycomyces terrestris]
MIIEAHDVGVTIGRRRIVHGESVRCEPGEMTALTGPSGSGKTSLLHVLGLLLPVTSGAVTADGTVVSGGSPRARRAFWRDHAAFVLQDYGIIDDESVAFNVALRRTRRADPRVRAALEHVGLQGREAEPAGHLSGGEKQRLALARAVHRDARALFVDEPTASLDAANRALVIGLLDDFARRGATVVVATHDEDMTAACAHRHPMNAPTITIH